MGKRKWGRYLFEFLSIFVAVISAFALNNWSENQRDRNTEVDILSEISNGLKKDIDDINDNMQGHRGGIAACAYWNRLVKGQEVKLDSFLYFYSNLTRDFISIQNNSGYESLKSKGLDLIKDDSLRYQIISFYEYDFAVLEKLEEDYDELQFHSSYFHTINNIITTKMDVGAQGEIKMKLPLKLTRAEKNTLLISIWKIKNNRQFVLSYYEAVESKISGLVEKINTAIQ